jgi:hypothetical protein
MKIMKLFTFTTGRTGTGFLYRAFQLNTKNLNIKHPYTCVHEGPMMNAFGTIKPEISHMHEYNNYGNTQYITDFWQKRFENMPKNYIETSHLNAKCGLIENLHLLHDDVTIMHITRNLRPLIVSFIKRGAFVSRVGTWVWYLDPKYSRNLVSRLKLPEGNFYDIAWYIVEVEARAQKLKHIVTNCTRHMWMYVPFEELIQPDSLRTITGSLDIPLKHFPSQTNPSGTNSFIPDEVYKLLDNEVVPRTRELLYEITGETYE